MKKDRSALKAGLFIVISIALVIGIIIGIKGISTFTEHREVRKAVFKLSDDVGGLRVGDEVRVGGYKVGEVKKIEVVKSEISAETEPDIYIHFSFPHRLDLKQGARLGIQSMVTGTSVLNFESLGSGQPLALDVALVGNPSTFSQILASIGPVSERLNGVLDDIRRQSIPAINQTVKQFGETAAAIKDQTVPKVNDTVAKYGKLADKSQELVADVRGPALEKWTQIADRTSEMMVKLRDLLGDSSPDIRGLLAKLHNVIKEFDAKFPGLLKQIDGVIAKLDTSMDQVGRTLDDVQATMSNAKGFTATAQSVVTDNKSKFNQMIDSLKTTSDNLKNASAEIRRSPWRLLYKPKEGEMANLNLFDATREFAEGANDLNDAAGALRDAMTDPHADKIQLQKLMERVDASFTKFKQVEDKLWSAVKD
ncbi:MAG TPA: MlaD family protein [Tepidisphaeraceae bacterium]|jgi:ABC-type transporter Mla subunit MlaD